MGATNNGKLIFPPGTAMSAKDRQTVEFAHIFYERPTNTISIPGEEGKHEPQITQDIETLLYEAELLRAMGSYPEYEFNSSTIGYGEKYPNNDVIPDHGGVVSATAAGLWA